MLARHAESLFWAGRYIERAEDTARMLDVTYHGLLEATPFEARRSWDDLLRTLRLELPPGDHDAFALGESIAEFLVVDAANPGSVVSAVSRARDNARSVRELISTELWEAINTFHLELRGRDLRADLVQQPYALYATVKRRCQMIAGVANETMPRDDGWRFLMIGWMLERAEMACRLLAVRFAQWETVAQPSDGGMPGGFHHWLGTLKSASASEAYRKVYRSSMDAADVVDFLLLSGTFPRSVLYCLRWVEGELSSLAPAGDRLNRPQRLLGRVRADLEFRDVHEIMQDDFHRFLDRLQDGVRQVAEAVALQYFRSSQELAVTVLDFHPAGSGPR